MLQTHLRRIFPSSAISNQLTRKAFKKEMFIFPGSLVSRANPSTPKAKISNTQFSGIYKASSSESNDTFTRNFTKALSLLPHEMKQSLVPVVYQSADDGCQTVIVPDNFDSAIRQNLKGAYRYNPAGFSV
jgi:hypothetical protein